MPITRIQGFDGSVTLPSGYNAKIKSYSVSLDMAMADVSVFQDTWRQFRGGIQGGSGSLTGVMVYDASTTSPGFVASRTTAGTLRLTQATGCYLEGSAFFTNISVQSSVDGDAVITMDFTFTGAVTETWDTSG